MRKKPLGHFFDGFMQTIEQDTVATAITIADEKLLLGP
jgi:hypothetical protein